MLTGAATVTRTSLEYSPFIYFFLPLSCLAFYWPILFETRIKWRSPTGVSTRQILFTHVRQVSRQSTTPALSLGAKDSHSIAIAMHNTSVETVVFTETSLLEVISMDKIVFDSQLCILIANNISYTSRWRTF